MAFPLPQINRRHGDALAWAGSILAAVLLHAVVGAALLLRFGSKPPASTAPPQAAMMVELAPSASSPERRESEMPPGPEQVEHQVQTERQIDSIPFDPPPEVAAAPTDALPPRKDVPEPQEKQIAVADRTTAVAASIADPDTAQRAPVEGSSSDAARAAIQTWESRLLAHLQHHKRYPGSARSQGQEDTVYLRFTMDRSGKVLAGKVWRSHGFAALNDEVNALIWRASPLPPPPDEMGGATIEMLVPVEFFLRRQVTRR